MNRCNRKILSGFINNQLEEDDRLDFLLHLDECPNCWELIYKATKAQHPHFYKHPNRRKNALDFDLDASEKEVEEEVFEVA